MMTHKGKGSTNQTGSTLFVLLIYVHFIPAYIWSGVSQYAPTLSVVG